MSKEYDVIVIGSGIGGLTTASLLAQLKNLKVLVLERHFKVGGFTHTFKRHGYTFDVGVHYIGDLHPGSRTRKLFDLTTGSGVQWQQMPDVFDKFVYPDFTVSVPSNKEAYIEVLCKLFPDESAAINQYFNDVISVCAAMQTKLAAGVMPAPIGAVMNAVNFDYKSKACISTAQYLDSHFKNPMLKAALTSQWGDYGLPPSLSSFAIHSLVVNHYLEGAFYPMGSAETIANAIVPIIKKSGGDVLVNHRVEEIVVQGGIAQGVTVRTLQGELLKFSAKAIISDAGVFPTYTKLLPSENRVAVPGFTDDIDSSSVTLYLGLKRSAQELGFNGENHWLYTGYDHDAAYASGRSLSGDLSFGYLSFASLKDPQASSHTAQLITIASASAFKEWESTGWKKRPAEYNAFKDRIAEKLLDVAETRYPGFRSLVDFKELSTPLTVESFTGHPAGRIYGQALTPEVMATRPFKADTHVKNLYLTGSDVLAPGVIGAFMGGVICAARIMGARGMLEIMSLADRETAATAATKRLSVLAPTVGAAD